MKKFFILAVTLLASSVITNDIQAWPRPPRFGGFSRSVNVRREVVVQRSRSFDDFSFRSRPQILVIPQSHCFGNSFGGFGGFGGGFQQSFSSQSFSSQSFFGN